MQFGRTTLLAMSVGEGWTISVVMLTLADAAPVAAASPAAIQFCTSLGSGCDLAEAVCRPLWMACAPTCKAKNVENQKKLHDIDISLLHGRASMGQLKD